MKGKISRKSMILITFIVVFIVLALFNYYLLNFIEKDLTTLYNNLGFEFQKVPKVILLNLSYVFLFIIFIIFFIFDYLLGKKYDSINLFLIFILIYFILNNFITSKMIIMETDLYLKDQSKINCFDNDVCLYKVIDLKKDYNKCKQLHHNNCKEIFDQKYIEYIKSNNSLYH